MRGASVGPGAAAPSGSRATTATASATERPAAATVRRQCDATRNTNRYQRIITSSNSGSIRSVRRYQRCRMRRTNPSRRRWRVIFSHRTASRPRRRSTRSAKRSRRRACQRSSLVIRFGRPDDGPDAGRDPIGPGSARGSRFFGLPTAIWSFHDSPGAKHLGGHRCRPMLDTALQVSRKRLRAHDTGPRLVAIVAR